MGFICHSDSELCLRKIRLGGEDTPKHRQGSGQELCRERQLDPFINHLITSSWEEMRKIDKKFVGISGTSFPKPKHTPQICGQEEETQNVPFEIS